MEESQKQPNTVRQVSMRKAAAAPHRAQRASSASELALARAAEEALRRGDAKTCEEKAQAALALNPRSAFLHNIRGAAREQLGQMEEALADFRQACGLDPKERNARLNEASCLSKLGRHDEAILRLHPLVTGYPGWADAHFALGHAHDALGCREDAVAAYRMALKADTTHGLAWYNLGNVLMDLGQLDEAVEAFGHASVHLPNYAAVYNNCANALKLLKQDADALLLYEAACAIDPQHVDARYNRALLLVQMQRWVRAIEACADLLKLAPEHAPGYNCLGVAFGGLRQHVQALDAFQTAARLAPDLAEAYANQAGTLEMLKRHEESIAAYRKTQELRPDYSLLLGRMSYRQLYVCDWTDYESNRKRLLEAIENDETVCDPFRILAFSESAAVHQEVARKWVGNVHGTAPSPSPPSLHPEHRRIRVGYFSADLHMHATALLMAQFFELHDRSRFELHAFSFGVRQEDGMNQRLRTAFEHFHDVRIMDDDAVVDLARQMEIDIAVDLKGFTLDSRLGIFQRRAAPVQISYLGFPGTLGAPFIDYILADKVLIPDSLRHFYDEKVIRVPGSYQVNDQKRQVHPETPARRDLGLPEDAFVFCCFNNNYKITPEVFDIWMRLLDRVPTSVLWLLSDSETVTRNLRAEAKARGVAPERLVFAPRANVQIHLARQRAADLFLDTLPCNAHTTASDALWVGLPVLTCSATAFASRVAASLLRAQGLDELVAKDLADYEAKAYELATNKAKMELLRRRAQSAVTAGQLFNTSALTRAIERAYELAHRRALDGLGPDHIDI